ncbi:MAG TPA: DUF6717 family protein [Tepidisphaeraceae bacterium]|nr:DUF6717 family protein [Tepidisphaeraceae bacterium]
MIAARTRRVGRRINPMPNQINTIKPYRWEGLWVFDDEAVGLRREAFVGGADDIIDVAVKEKGLPDPHGGFLMQFSADPFPGADLEFTWLRGDMGGNVYRWEGHGMDGWLCPALFRYFDAAPAKIYVRVRGIEKQGE